MFGLVWDLIANPFGTITDLLLPNRSLAHAWPGLTAALLLKFVAKRSTGESMIGGFAAQLLYQGVSSQWSATTETSTQMQGRA